MVCEWFLYPWVYVWGGFTDGHENTRDGGFFQFRLFSAQEVGAFLAIPLASHRVHDLVD